MLACPGIVSNKAYEARFSGGPERQRGWLRTSSGGGGGVSRENQMKPRYTWGVRRFPPAKETAVTTVSSANLPWRAVIVWG